MEVIGDWGLGTRDWGDEGDEGDGEEGRKSSPLPPAPLLLPNPQSPIVFQQMVDFCETMVAPKDTSNYLIYIKLNIY
ncbi:hypothetical protein FACHB389_06875 [Nostoc calcicola FACHB-389]|nr:hypothetical protein FACHB389_06875 [Nostoc calcicola FACHB-389]